MKRCCKTVDITSRELISEAVHKCLKKKLYRKDTLKMFEEYTGTPFELLQRMARDRKYDFFEGQIQTVIDGVRSEILADEIVFKPIYYIKKQENNKIRNVGIQNVKHQIYDYIAVCGLKELFDRKIGPHQYSSIPGKGPHKGMKTIKKWLKNKEIRYAWKGDAEHYYENINVGILKKQLSRDVKNDRLLRLVFLLIDSFQEGLSIGSFLSQYLANYFMSMAYHFAESMHVVRKSKREPKKNIKTIDRVLIYMDDILFLSKNLKRLTTGVRLFKEWVMQMLSIKVKDDDKTIDLRNGYIDMLGFLISRKKVIVRPRIFKRLRRSINKVRRQGFISRMQAGQIISRYGWFQAADTKRFCNRNKVNNIIALCKEMKSNGKNVIYLKAA